MLVNTVLNAGTPGLTSEFDGVAVGLVLTACILMGGPLTGGSLNPARSLGPAIIADRVDDLWVYFVGPALGGLAAAALWRYVLRPARGKQGRG